MATLKEALYENLMGILSDQTNLRNNAEQQIKVFEVTSEYGQYLAEIALDPSINWPIRQLAAVLLKQFIDIHWSINRDKFEEPEIPSHVKSRIRSLLINALGEPTPNGLTENSPEKKLRSSIAHAVSVIAYCEWPEEWTDLFNILIGYLSSGDMGVIYGAMKVFSDICHEITDNQIPSIAPVLYPKMHEIFTDKNTFSSSTRGRAVQIFTIISETVFMIEQFDKNAVRVYLEPYLPQFTESLLKALNDPDSDIVLKKNILNALIVLLKNCRKRIWKWVPQILAPIWQIMTTSADVYVYQHVNTESQHADTADPPVDSDGEVLSLDGLILAVFEFIDVIVESVKTRALIRTGIPDLIYYIIKYMQITDDQLQNWIANPDQFVEDEDEDSYTYSVRVSGLEIILALAKEYEYEDDDNQRHEFQLFFIQALEKHFEESNAARQQGNPNWWKPQEASLTTLGALCNNFRELLEDKDNQMNYKFTQILDHVFNNRDDSFPFLAGRSLWVAARYSFFLNEHMIQNFLRSIVSALNNPSPIIQIAGVRSSFNICVHMVEAKNQTLGLPYYRDMVEGCLTIGKQHSNEVLKLCLDTLAILMTVNDQFVCDILDRVLPLVMDTFLANADDPQMLGCVQEIFREIFKNPLTHKQCEIKILPSFVQILKEPSSNQNAQHLKPITLDVLSIFVRYSPQPLSDILLNQCFPLVCHTLLSTTDETSLMQNGGETIRSFVCRGSKQLAQFRDPESGLDGMSLVMRACMHLLDTRVPENCATFVGRLIFSTIQRGSEFLGDEKIHLLLRSVLSKLQTSEIPSVTQSLIMVFAHLINHNLETVIGFLGSLPGPSGSNSALEFVLNHWLNKQNYFFGNYDNKVSLLALCKLLEHSISSPGKSHNLNQIMVYGDQVITDNVGVKTRSRSASNPDEWTMIPCSVKIFKILLHELYHIINEEEDSDEEEESDDDITANDRTRFAYDNSINRSQVTLMNEIYEIADHETCSDDEDDPDVQEDPISKINLVQYLSDFFKQLLKTPHANEFSRYLNESEMDILQKLN